MAAYASSFPKVQRNMEGFVRVLKFTACEWILIFLLFIDAALSYMLTSFARYCELEIPCILCSRLDHVFGNAIEGFYRTLFCRNHRSEISFLHSCDIHDKLVDSRGMCDDCLSSHVEGHESNSDMQRLKLGKPRNDSSQNDRVTRLCLCCNKPWIPRPSSNRLLPLKSHGTAVAKPNIPLTRSSSPVHDLKMMSDKFISPAASHLPGKTGLPLSANNGYRNSIIRDINEHEKEFVHKRQADDANESRDVRCLDPESENAVCEHKEKPAHEKADFNELPELISLDDYPPSSSLMEVPSFSASLLADLISLVDNTSHSVNVKDVPVKPFSDNCKSENISANKNDEILKLISTSTGSRFETDIEVDDTPMLKSTVADPSAPEFVTKYMLAYTNGANEDHKSLPAKNVIEASKNGNISLNKNDNISNLISTASGNGFQTDQVVDDTAVVDSTNGDPSAVQKLPVCDEDTSASEFVTKPMVTSNNGVNEDLKSLPGQNPSGGGVHLSLNNLSPELQDRAVELLRTESNSSEVRNLQNLFFQAINESDDLKYFDESSIIEGENQLDGLKQQVENHQNYINALYKELEEERNASSIAANQAMAMITRLQEEKAALRMEALQYLRMMEEQAEYDTDALEKANELLTEKEKELQDLEEELEYYRLNFSDETPEETESNANINLNKEHATTCTKQDNLKNGSETMFPEACVVDDSPVVITAWSEIEDEKEYISHWLQRLEEKLNKLARYGDSLHSRDGGHDDEKDHKRMQKGSWTANGSAPCEESLSSSIRKDEETSDEQDEDCRENGLEALENEILELNERMETLEGDCSFLQHSLNSLKNGNEGLILIQEILHLMRQVKKIGLKTMNSSVL